MFKIVTLLFIIFGIQNLFCKGKKETVIVKSSSFKNIDDLLYAPIEEFLYSPAKGLKCFFVHKFNNPKYATEVLPYSLRDLIDFLKFCKKTEMDRTFVRDIIRVFKQKLTSVDFISADELAKTIDQFPLLIGSLAKENDLEKKENIKQLIQDELEKSKKNGFKESSINRLTDQIFKSLNENNIETSAEELAETIYSFSEVSVGKACWSFSETSKPWQEFKNLGDAIYRLYTEKLIRDEAKINDLIVSLVAAFTKLLTLTTELPESFFVEAKLDLDGNEIEWLCIDEADEMISPKSKVLSNALMAAEIKSKAKRDFGFIAEDDLGIA